MGSLSKLVNLARIRKRAWLSRAELMRSQDRRIAVMLDHAYRTVPYYRNAWKGLGLEGYPIRCFADLERLPIIGKAEIQADPQAFISDTADRSNLLEMHTSGSTGLPLKIYYGAADDDYSKVNNLRSFLEVGYRYGDNFVTISDPDWTEGRYGGKKGISIQRRLNLFYPIDVNMRLTAGAIVDELESIGRCDVLYGYPSSIRLVAQEVRRRPGTSVRPRIVVSNGENLDPVTRDYIDETFATKMYNFYTTEESKRIAWECDRHQGMHLDVESVALELTRDGRQVPDGEMGSVQITNLFNFTMPLIRYRQGDVASKDPDPCPCGRGAPLLRSLEGRVDSFVVNADGKLFSPQVFWSIFRHYSSVSQFFITQDQPDKLSIQVALAYEEDRSDLAEIMGKITTMMGPNTRTELKIGPVHTTGKRKAVHSTLAEPIFR
jgi:phenylacetate-CoA ligase